MDSLLSDVRLAARRALSSPGHAALVVGLVALGIGANAALFSVVNATLLAPLPYSDSARLVQVSESQPERGQLRFGVSAPAFVDWRERTRGVATFAAYLGSTANLSGGRDPERVSVVRATRDLFRVLAVAPVLGRTFAAEEEQPGGDAVVLLGHDFWRASFAGDPAVVGRRLRIDGASREVVGVLPRLGFPFEGVAVFEPLAFSAGDRERRGARWLLVVGRLAPGASIDEARSEMRAAAARDAALHPETNRGWTVDVDPLARARGETSRAPLLLLWGAASLVLLVVCANVAGLLLVRGLARGRELAVRVALGASPRRIVRQVVVESLLLTGAGALVGVLLAVLLPPFLARALSDASTPPRVDLGTLAFLAGLAVAVGLLVGLAPALQSRRLDVEKALRQGAPAVAGPGPRLRPALVVGQQALAVTLVVASGLVLRSLERVLDVPPGFDARPVLALRVAPPQPSRAPAETDADFLRSFLASRARAFGFYETLLERLRALPGVEGAGAINRLPLTGQWWTVGLRLPGVTPSAGDRPGVYGRVVSAGYFRTLRIPLRGRDFDRRDDGDARPVAIVSEAFARRHWPGLDPLGRQLGLDDDDSPWLTVIGVAGDVRADGLDEDARPTVYVPLAQSRFGFYPDWGMDLVVRSTRDPAALAAAVRGVVRVEDGGLPVFAVATLEERLRDSLARRRQTLALLGCFAATALGLSALGLYGVMAHRTRLRTREIGVRLALGARPGGIVSLVLKEGLVLVLVGGVLGLAGGVAVGRVAQALLYETSPLDPTTMAAAAALLLAVALLAVLLPARRAARVDPLEALRQE